MGSSIRSTNYGRRAAFACAAFILACSSEPAQQPELHTSTVELSEEGLPLEDVACQVRDQDGSVSEWTYEASSRTLATERLQITFDEAGRYLTRGDPTTGWLHEHEYDEHGQRTVFLYSSQGRLSEANSTTYKPEYTSGQLTSVTFTQHDGLRSGTYEFSYEDGRVTRERLTQTDESTSRVVETTFRYDDQGRVASEERGVELTRFEYDEHDRLISKTIDGFVHSGAKPDGTPEIEMRWYYDARGVLYRFTIDGTTKHDNPVVDGELDVDQRFSDECMALLVVGRDEVFRFPDPPGSY